VRKMKQHTQKNTKGKQRKKKKKLQQKNNEKSQWH